MVLEPPSHSRQANKLVGLSYNFDITLSALLAVSPTTIHLGDCLATADRDVLLHAIFAALAYVEALPAEDEVSKICANEDADDDVSVVIHCKQHDEVCDCELQHMEKSTNSLLEDTGAEILRSESCASRGSLAVVGRSRGCNGGCRSVGSEVLLNDVAVILFAGAAKEFEKNHKENDADARTCEHALRGNTP